MCTKEGRKEGGCVRSGHGMRLCRELDVYKAVIFLVASPVFHHAGTAAACSGVIHLTDSFHGGLYTSPFRSPSFPSFQPCRMILLHHLLSAFLPSTPLLSTAGHVRHCAVLQAAHHLRLPRRGGALVLYICREGSSIPIQYRTVRSKDGRRKEGRWNMHITVL